MKTTADAEILTKMSYFKLPVCIEYSCPDMCDDIVDVLTIHMNVNIFYRQLLSGSAIMGDVNLSIP